VVEAVYPPEYRHGQAGLRYQAALQRLAAWSGDARIGEFPHHSFAFLDTETTGLAGGTGTYAFLVGVGRFEGDHFHLAQFFMRDPDEEPALLLALEQFLAPCQALVTFNGKAFDIPLLNTRYIMQGWQTPYRENAHVDLLPLARRLWRNRLPSRTLGNLEVQILGVSRAEEDIPGWMIPQLYIDYLRSGDSRPLKGVFYHNAMDVLSLAALLNHTAGMLAQPLDGTIEHAADLLSLARVYEDLGEISLASEIYHCLLDQELSREHILEALNRLALIHKRQGDLSSAIPLWEKAAELEHIEACVELAKYYEHRCYDYPEAVCWTEQAVQHCTTCDLPTFEKKQIIAELEHRLRRLRRLMARQPS